MKDGHHDGSARRRAAGYSVAPKHASADHAGTFEASTFTDRPTALRLSELMLGTDGEMIGRAFHLLIQGAPNRNIGQAWSRAARAFFQATCSGRPKIDDAAALAEAEMLLERKIVPTPHAALMRVARRISRHENPASTYERLRRKRNVQKNHPRNGFSGIHDPPLSVADQKKENA